MKQRWVEHPRVRQGWAWVQGSIVWRIVVAALLQAVTPAPAVMAQVARWGFVLLMAFWSTRRVADALAEEVGGGTWESQRMSGLSAWSMVWGKIIGGAIFPWYCALICLGIMVYYGLLAAPGDMRLPVWKQAGTLLLGGILGQAAALTVALIWMFLPKDRVQEGASPMRELGAFKRKQVWFTLGIGAVGFGGLFSVFSYIASTATEVAHMPENAVPVMMALFGSGMIVGNLVGAWFADKALMGTIAGTLVGSIVVMSVLSPEGLIREHDEVRRVIRAAGTGDEPVVIVVEAADELREDELAAILGPARGSRRPVILRIAADG